jgi:hypothetical protein
MRVQDFGQFPTVPTERQKRAPRPFVARSVPS